MSTEEPTAPEESSATKASPEEDWNVLEGRIGGAASGDERSAPSQAESESEEEKGWKRLLSRRARFGVAGGSAVLVVALASVAVTALVGGEVARRPRSRPGAVHAKRRGAEKRGSGRARWVREAGGSARPPHRRTAPGRSRARSHTRPRRKPSRPVRQKAEAPSQPPEPAQPQAQPPEPSAPAPAAPSAPEERPGLRDGATESTEFGL
jgi:hypothetical protein